MSIGLCDFFENILKMCNGCALGCVLGFVLQGVLGDVLELAVLLYEFCSRPTRSKVNICFVGYFDEKMFRMC